MTKFTSSNKIKHLAVLLFAFLSILCYNGVKAAPLVCGADDTCVNVTLYNFCYGHPEIAPVPRDFIVRMHNITTNNFFDQVVTLDEVRDNTFIYVTTFTSLNKTNLYKLMVHYNNQQWIPWTDAQKPPFDVIWNLGEDCLPLKTHLPLITN